MPPAGRGILKAANVVDFSEIHSQASEREDYGVIHDNGRPNFMLF
jgi:pimeloyl-CoA synthetase